MKYQVEYNGWSGWQTVVREDLYDGTNDEVLKQQAVFETREEAESFILRLCGLMHMGGDPDEFRVVELIAVNIRCLYCYADVEHDEAPALSDDEAWQKIADEHADDCEWVLTRAHRLEPSRG